MAINTVGKRASALIDDCGIVFPPVGSFSHNEFEWMLGQYTGIATIIPATSTPFYRPYSTETADVFLKSTETVDVLLRSTETVDVLPGSVDEQVQ